MQVVDLLAARRRAVLEQLVRVAAEQPHRAAPRDRAPQLLQLQRADHVALGGQQARPSRRRRPRRRSARPGRRARGPTSAWKRSASIPSASRNRDQGGRGVELDVAALRCGPPRRRCRPRRGRRWRRPGCRGAAMSTAASPRSRATATKLAMWRGGAVLGRVQEHLVGAGRGCSHARTVRQVPSAPGDVGGRVPVRGRTRTLGSRAPVGAHPGGQRYQAVNNRSRGCRGRRPVHPVGPAGAPARPAHRRVPRRRMALRTGGTAGGPGRRGASVVPGHERTATAPPLPPPVGPRLAGVGHRRCSPTWSPSCSGPAWASPGSRPASATTPRPARSPRSRSSSCSSTRACRSPSGCCSTASAAAGSWSPGPWSWRPARRSSPWPSRSASPLLGRLLVGLGDAATFISVLRLVPAWFPARRVPAGHAAHRHRRPDRPGAQRRPARPAARRARAGRSRSCRPRRPACSPRCSSCVVVRDSPARCTARAGPRRPGRGRRPGQRLAAPGDPARAVDALHHAVLRARRSRCCGASRSWSPARGSGRAPPAPCSPCSSWSGMVSGPVLGVLVQRHPFRRSWLVLAVVAVNAAGWTLVLAWPGPAPLPVLVVLVLAMASGGPGSLIGFDFARTFNPPEPARHRDGDRQRRRLRGLAASRSSPSGSSSTCAPGGASATTRSPTSGRPCPCSTCCGRLGVVAILVSRRRVRRRMAEAGVVVPPVREALRQRRARRRG